MRRILNYITLSVFGLLLLTNCRDPFEIKSGYGEGGFLVVDGYINVGEGITSIKLSRTTPLSESVTLIRETGATVLIEDDEFSYLLLEQSNGTYISEELGLTVNNQYRLRITTMDGNVYLSEYTSPTQVPPIDSVSWTQDQQGVKIFVTTHDPLNNTQYYKWHFEEVWEQQSAALSFIKYEGGQFSNRSNDDIKNAYTCWRYDSSSTINTASTTDLFANTIRSNPITFIPQYDERIAVRYSILVKQHGLSKDAFNFFEILLKNNESLGTFSDPQPSQLPTNIKCITSNEVVVGFVTSSTTEIKRLFIDRTELFRWDFQLQCNPIELGFDTAQAYMKWYTPTTNISELVDGQPVLVGVNAVLHACADCRKRGGSNTKPLFWDITEE